MAQCIPLTRAILALLIVAATVAMSAEASELALAALEGAPGLAPGKEKANEIFWQANNEQNRKKIRKENDKRLKTQESLYPHQAESLARHYKETAAMVVRQGGNPQPLLDAAAYFERQSK